MMHCSLATTINMTVCVIFMERLSPQLGRLENSLTAMNSISCANCHMEDCFKASKTCLTAYLGSDLAITCICGIYNNGLVVPPTATPPSTSKKSMYPTTARTYRTCTFIFIFPCINSNSKTQSNLESLVGLTIKFPAF